MRYVFTIVATFAALTLIAASCMLNFLYWSAQGAGHEGLVLGLVSIAADLLKAVLPMMIGYAICARRWNYVALATPMFLVLFAAGLIAALGYVAGNRSSQFGGRESMNARLELALAELKDTETRISKITGYPPISELEASITKLRLNPLFSRSRSCSDATATESRALCSELATATGSLGSAIEANRLTSKRDAIVSEVSHLRASGAGVESDPQAGIIARWVPGLTVGTVRDGLALFFACLIEFGAAFGLFLATGHGGITVRSIRSYPDNLDATVKDNQRLVSETNPKPTPAAIARSTAVTVTPRRFIPDPRWVDGVRG